MVPPVYVPDPEPGRARSQWPAEHMKQSHSKLPGSCVAAEKALWVGSGSDMEFNVEKVSTHRGPGRAGKRTPMEDAAGASRQTCLQKVESVEPSLASSMVGEFVGTQLSITSVELENIQCGKHTMCQHSFNTEVRFQQNGWNDRIDTPESDCAGNTVLAREETSQVGQPFVQGDSIESTRLKSVVRPRTAESTSVDDDAALGRSCVTPSGAHPSLKP